MLINAITSWVAAYRHYSPEISRYTLLPPVLLWLVENVTGPDFPYLLGLAVVLPVTVGFINALVERFRQVDDLNARDREVKGLYKPVLLRG
jgi:hypothetical protein